jgi:sortase B
LSENKNEKVLYNDDLREQEIDSILSSLNLSGGSEEDSSEFSELLERYGVKEEIMRDVEAISASAQSLSDPVYDDNALYDDTAEDYSDDYEYLGAPVQKSIFDESAARVLYDEDLHVPNGSIFVKKIPQTPHYYDENGFRIIYDEDLVNGGRPVSNGVQKKKTKDLSTFTDITKTEAPAEKAETEPAVKPEEPSAPVNELIDPIKSEWLIPDEKEKKKKEKNTEKKAKKQPEKAAASDTDTPKAEEAQENKDSKFVRFLKNFLPWKGDPGKEIVRKLIMLASLCIIVYYSVYFINYFRAYGSSIKDMDELAELTSDYDNNNDTEAVWESIRQKYPNVNFPAKLNPKFAPLYAINQDFGGWISIGNTNIDAVVVKSSDNKDYLKTNFYGKENKYGTLFLDYRNFRNGFDELDRNTIIHGHNMKDGLMFAQLENYMKPQGFIDSPLIIYDTPYQTYYWKVYAVVVTNGLPKDDNGYLFNYIVPNFQSDEAFMEYIRALDERKLYDTGVGIQPTDKILTLSTCSYEFKEARLAVVARLVRPGESVEIDPSLVKVNPNPRYPQAWYDAKKLDNPYNDAYKWQP